MNSGVSWPLPESARERVLGIQHKLHKWSTDDQDRRFKDLHNLVCDPATLMVAWMRVRANRGSRSAGVDGQTAYHIEQVLGVQEFLGRLREELRCGSFRPAARSASNTSGETVTANTPTRSSCAHAGSVSRAVADGKGQLVLERLSHPVTTSATTPRW